MFQLLNLMLIEDALSLTYVQIDLSLRSSNLPADSLKKINPNEIFMHYMDIPGMPKIESYTIWEAVMEIVVSSYRIATMDISQVNDTADSTVHFVMRNALNNVLINLGISSNEIMDEINNSKQFNITIFIILVSLASFGLIISLSLLIPIFNTIKTNKKEVFHVELPADESVILENYPVVTLNEKNTDKIR